MTKWPGSSAATDGWLLDDFGDGSAALSAKDGDATLYLATSEERCPWCSCDVVVVLGPEPYYWLCGNHPRYKTPRRCDVVQSWHVE